MKNPIIFILLACITSSLAAQSKQYFHYTAVDQNGKTTSYYKAKNITAEEENALSLHIAKNTGSVTRDGNPVYKPTTVNYDEIKNALKKITGQEFEDKIFLLEYTYLNDRCSSNDNTWDKAAIRKRKQFTNPQKKEIEKRNKEVVILNIFEEGISLSNSPGSKKEYFFTDIENFLRKNLFPHPTTCGSFALIKPNGQALVRNGESYTWLIEQHLKPETWALFFSEEN